MIVYIASPYAGDVEANTKFAIDACRVAIACGHTPIAPHLLYPQILDDSNPSQREMALRFGQNLIAVCGEFWICGDDISPGMANEIREAEALGIKTKRLGTQKIEELGAFLRPAEPTGGMEMKL
jgi:hypothetical protein